MQNAVSHSYIHSLTILSLSLSLLEDSWKLTLTLAISIYQDLDIH